VISASSIPRTRSSIAVSHDGILDNTQQSALPSELLSALRRREIPGLNGLRAIAVLLVILYHAGLPVPGGLGVLIFFVLSGFLITWLALNEFADTGRMNLRQFYIRRALRIFPAFYTYAGLLLALLLITHKKIIWPQVIASLLYVNNYYQAVSGDPNSDFSHTWSLGVEEQFYLLWAPCLVLLLRKDHVFLFLPTAITAFWGYRYILLALGTRQQYIYAAFDTRADQLLCGCLFAVVLFEGRWRKLIRILCFPATVGTVAAVLIALSCEEFFKGSTFRDAVSFTVEPPLVAMLIPGLIANARRYPVRILEWKWFSGLGRLSYSMYLYQQLIIWPTEKVLREYPSAVKVSVSLLATIIAALLSFNLVEKPFLKLKTLFKYDSTPRCDSASKRNAGILDL
jgi:peptidoglycan/LPS O-acetylase OafA/YrhL